MRRLAIVAAFLLALPAFGGAPLKGVDVKLGKNPGGSPAARTTTDAKGAFSFPVMPKGSYWVSFESKTTDPGADVTVTSARTTVSAEWNLRSGRRMGPGTGAAAKAGQSDKLVIESDGTHPVQGTVVKSKSNITNN